MRGISDLQPKQEAGGAFLRHFRDVDLAIVRWLREFISAIVLLALLLEPMAPLSAANSGAAARKSSEAFAKYVGETDSRNTSELQRKTDLLWIDALPEETRKKAYADLRRGEVQLTQHTTPGSGREIPCPDCMIHHWEGVVFVPGARLDDVLQVLEDYNHHAQYYSPDVVAARIDERDGDHFKVFLRFRRQKVITVVLNSEHEITYYRDSALRAHSRSSATHIAEVENPGKPNEREKSREDDNGFLWGMETWWRMEEKDNGVYVRSEVVSLSRNVPAGLGWMIGSFVTAVPKESLTFTLEATRKAVLAQLRGKNSN